MVGLPNILFQVGVEEGDGMADNYYDFRVFTGGITSSAINSIGHNRDDNLVALVHATNIGTGNVASLEVGGTSTDYQNTTGLTVYVILTVRSSTGTGDKTYKIYSAPTTDSIAGATEVFDSTILPYDNSFDNTDEGLTSFLVPIQDNHFIVLENTSGSGDIDIPLTLDNALVALVVEPSAL